MARFAPLVCAALLLLPAANARAAASADTGTELVALCEQARSGAEGSIPAMKCTAYLIGLFDALRTFSMNSRDALICAPGAVRDEQFATAYLTWAQYNPNRLPQYPVAGALEALIQAFPCKREAPPPPPAQRRR